MSLPKCFSSVENKVKRKKFEETIYNLVGDYLSQSVCFQQKVAQLLRDLISTFLSD